VRETVGPAIQNALDRFAGLRSVREGVARVETRLQGTVDRDSTGVALLAADREDTTALANAAPPAQASTQDALQTRGVDRAADASIRLLAAQNARGAGAVEMSRANTTEEIRENLQTDSSRIERGLRADADEQARENVRTAAGAAETAGERNRAQTVAESERQVRDLRSEAQSLQRELQATQREIRTLQNDARRARSPAAGATTRTAAGLANRVDILAA
jgi:hypothetical protein